MFVQLVFAFWLGAGAAEDGMRGGVGRRLLAGAFFIPVACGVLFGRYEALVNCAFAMLCFAVAEKFTRAVMRTTYRENCIAHNRCLGDADIFAAGIIALYTGALWCVCVFLGASLCGICCVAAKKRRAPFIPFLNAGTIICLALCDMNIFVLNGGLL